MPSGARVSKLLGCATAATVALGASEVLGEFDAQRYLVYDFGRLSIRPSLELAEVYDSNLFYMERDEISDLISYVRPGVTFLYGDRENSFISLRYNAEAAFYSGLDDGLIIPGSPTPIDTTDLNYFGHQGTLNTRFLFSRLSITGSDSFSISRTTLGGNFSYVQSAVGQTSLSDQWRFDYSVSPRTLVGLRAGMDMVDYDSKDLIRYHLYDYLQFSGGVRAGYIPSDKIVVFPEVVYSRAMVEPNRPGFPESPILSGLSFGVGAEGDFTPKLTGIISGGYQMREYDDATEIPNGWVAEARLSWALRAKTTLSASFRHSIQVSREARAVPYEADRAGIGATQEFGTQGRWTATIDGYYQWDTYDRPVNIGTAIVDRSGTIMGATLRTSFRWKAWLTLIGSYDFLTYSDNIPAIFDYDVHRFTLRAVAGF